MAISTQGPRTWFTNTTSLDTRAFDILRLENGKLMVAFGGASSINPALHTALVNLSTGTVGAFDTTTWAPEGTAGTIRKLDLTAGDNGSALVTFHSYASSAGGADTNSSLVTLRVVNGEQSNVAPRAVNPGGAVEDTDDNFTTVHLAGGGYAVFFTEPGPDGYTDLSNGIRMARFDEAGNRVGTTKTVIGERIVNTLVNLENNPEQPSATLLNNGNIGLFYKENVSDGSSRFMMQELAATGSRVGGAVSVTSGAITSPEVDHLSNGHLLASWFDVVTGKHRGRVLDADGDPMGGAFNISAGFQAPYSQGEVVALANGFAHSWFDTTYGLWMAQLFTADGTARSNPFLVTDTAGDFASAGTIGGLERNGTGFVGYVIGTKPGDYTTQMDGQTFSGAGSLGVTRTGDGANETLNGGAKDDRLTLGGGNDRSTADTGNDLQYGGNGQDTLNGGAGFDWMDGGAGNDVLDGGSSTDILTGDDGNDRLLGGAGSDRITGGFGRDTVIGGAGADTFIFSGPTDQLTTVTDFDVSEGDKLKLFVTQYGFLGFFGPQIGTEKNPTSSGLYFNTNTHILSNDRDGSGTLYERVNIAYLPGVETLSIFDIVTF